MGSIRGKNKSLRRIFIYFLGCMLGFSLLIIGVNYGLLNYALDSKIVYPANYAESFIQKNSATLKGASTITLDMIPDGSDFGVYDVTGNYQYGSFPENGPEHLEKIGQIWKNYENGDSSFSGSEFIYVIQRENEVLLITYPISLQFSDMHLRQAFPKLEALWIGFFGLEMVILILLLSINFGKYLGKKIAVLQQASWNIENQNLDFDLGGSDVREINQVLDSLYHLRDALKESLLQQWQIKKGKQEQISALAHDIKTPLTIIKGNVELLGETTLDQEQMLYQKYIIENATQIEGYINKLVELSKSETPQGLTLKKVAVKDLLDEIHEQTKGLIIKKNIKLNWQEIDIAKEVIQADLEKLYRAIMNVMGNAVEFTPSQETIAVTVKKKDGELILTICDGGKGFGAQALRHGKEQFFMGDTSRTDHKHHGMGLYIADNIVKQHGGQLVVGNTAQGGLVTITLKV